MSATEEESINEEITQEEEEYLHPLVRQGFKIIYDKALTVETNDQDQDYSVKVFVSPADGDTTDLRVELTNESDIYYVTCCELQQNSFEDLKKKQHLRKGENFASFISNITKILDNVNSNRTTFRAIYSINDNSATLTFKQQLEFKSITIFSLDFQQAERSDEYVKAQAQFRYNEKEHFLRDQISVLNELLEHVEAKNPQLAQQFKRGSKFAQ